MFADSYPMREIQDGFFYEVDGKVRGAPVQPNCLAMTFLTQGTILCYAVPHNLIKSIVIEP